MCRGISLPQAQRCIGLLIFSVLASTDEEQACSVATMFVPERKHEQECASGLLTGHTEQMYQHLSSKTLP